MSLWRRFITEAHRRNLWQVLGMYLVACWVGFQVVLALVQGIGLPAWLPPFAAVLFVLGLPIVLVTAWVQEGIRSRARARAAERLDPTLFPDFQPGGTYDVPGSAPVEPALPGRGPLALALSRRLTWRRALLAGVGAFALLGLLTAGWVGLRALGLGPMASLVAAEELERDARILIADFTARNADTTLAAVVTEAFRIDFARSTLLRSVEPAEVRDVLQRMGRTELPRLDPELAHQVAVRDGISAYITGELTGAGSGFVLTAKLIATESGDVLVALRERAGDADGVIDAIDRLSKSLRERTGESLRTLRRAEPLAQVTTASLEALRFYTQGLRASSWEGDPERSQQLHEEAIRADSTFAMAHAALAVNFFNAGRNEQGIAAAERALRYSERLGELERARIQGTYYLARRDYQEAARALHRVLAIDSVNHAAHNNLGLVYDQVGDTLRARHHFERAIAADTGRFFAYTNLGEHLVLEGRLAEAERALGQAVERAPTSAWPVTSLAQLPYIGGDIAGTQERLLRLQEDPKMPESVQERAGDLYRQTLRVTGRLEEALTLSRAETSSSDGPEAAAAWEVIDRTYYDALVSGRPDRAAARVGQLRQLVGKADDPDLAVWLAIACAAAGDARCGQAALERAKLDGPVQPWTSIEIRAAHAALALARNQPEAAQTILTGDDYRCRNCFLPMLGRTLRQWQQPDSAAAVYERFVRSTSIDRIWVDDELAPIHEWLAGYYEERGDRAAAARHYARFVELWQEADPELQPRVAEARRRLVLLQPDR